ncbi:MAG: 4Fe-4S binding protein, partial [Treponema sp.]|nr:4Fe-4S binding protein [Treponema sp.]
MMVFPHGILPPEAIGCGCRDNRGTAAGGAEGIVTGSLLVFVVLFLSAAFLGRGFCSYACPAGALQDAVARGGSRPFPRGGRWLKWVVWGSWLVGLGFLFRR